MYPWYQAPLTVSMPKTDVGLLTNTNEPLGVAERDWITTEATNQNQTKVQIGSPNTVALVTFNEVLGSVDAKCYVSQGKTSLTTILSSSGATECQRVN